MQPTFFPRIRLRCLALLAGLALSVSLPATAKDADSKAAKATKKAAARNGDPAAAVFASDTVPILEIEIPEAGMDRLREYSFGGRGGDSSERQPAKATVREGTNVYLNVAVHLKGSAGSFRSVDDRPALTLNFDKFTKHQTFHGLERLSLNNSLQDPSYLSEQICRELFAAGGVPVPRASHAIVKLNGRHLGLYVLLEAYNKQFLRRAFKNDEGNLYDGGFVREITDNLEKSSGPNPNDRSDLERLANAANEPDPAKRFNRLKEILDVDEFIAYLAIDVMTCNGDGYAMNRNNYRIYHNPVNDRMVFMPHGMDQMFGTFRSDTRLRIIPPMQGLVANALLHTPEGKKLYRQRFTQIYTNIFHLAAITNRLQQLAAKIGPAVEQDPKRRAAYFSQEVQQLQDRIVDRAQFLDSEIHAPSRALSFDAAGRAPLDGWKSRLEYGRPRADETTDGDKRSLLHLETGAESSVGVWTARVVLDAGSYRFSGRVKCRGVVPEPGDRKGGAVLRTHNRRAGQKVVGDADWTEVHFDFEVDDDAQQLELRCELRAIEGEAWFDRNSLHLTRK